MSSLRQDVKQTFRTIRNAPVFFAVVVLTLAIGIGANTALFSIVKAVLLEPLPYPESDRLVTTSPDRWNPAEIYIRLKESGKSFEGVGAIYPRQFAVTGGEQPYELEGAEVTPNLLRLYGASMALGRGFVDSDARPDAPRTAVLSHEFWQARFGGSPDVVDRVIQINGEPHQVVGVTARGFRMIAPESENLQIWVPFEPEALNAEGTRENWAIPMARLGKGVSLERGQAELDVVTKRYSAANPAEGGPERWNLRLATLKSELIQNISTALLVLQLAVGVVLLIACINVANLLLARSSSRQGEMAIRSALGASKGRLLRQVLTESVVLSLLGGLASLLLLLFALKLILRMAPQNTPRIDEVSIDLSVLLFTLGVSVATGLLFGAVPAISTARKPIHDFLKEGGRAPSGSRRRHRTSQALVVAEVTLTLVLLVGAGLLVRSFVTLTSQEPGFRTEGVLTVAIRVPPNRYENVRELEAFYARVQDRVRQIPGVQAVGVANNLPISRGNSWREYLAEGEAEVPENIKAAEYGVVSPGYFEALDIPLLGGRYFDDSDRRGHVRVAVIDRAMAERTWPKQDPIGQRFRFEDGEDALLTVVGVVDGIRGNGLANKPRAGFFISYQQRPETSVELAVGRRSVLVVQSRLEPEQLAGSLRQAVWEIDPQQPVPEISTMKSVIAEGVGPERFRAVLLGTLAALALILVVAGIYGVIEYLVVERTHEFGIRMAMGATGNDIVTRVLKWGLSLTAVGIAVGLVGVFALNRYLADFLFGVTPTDALTVLGSISAVVLVTLAACWIPARRATRVDPIVALRSERRSARPSAGARRPEFVPSGE